METYNKLKPITYKLADFKFKPFNIRAWFSKTGGYGFINWVAVGQFTGSSNLLDGVGILVDWIGGIKEGYWEDGRLHGQGKYTSGSEYYVGDYRDGRFNGEGTFYWGDRRKYVGHFKDGFRYGKGIQYIRDEQIEKQEDWADRDSLWFLKV